MNCPGSDRCEIREHKGYITCELAGACQNDPQTAIRKRAPYPDFCSMPSVCATDGRCHRDPCCID